MAACGEEKFLSGRLKFIEIQDTSSGTHGKVAEQLPVSFLSRNSQPRQKRPKRSHRTLTGIILIFSLFLLLVKFPLSLQTRWSVPVNNEIRSLSGCRESEPGRQKLQGLF